ncbi:hypothetical protein M569_00590, partial [Genlisea aurea]
SGTESWTGRIKSKEFGLVNCPIFLDFIYFIYVNNFNTPVKFAKKKAMYTEREGFEPSVRITHTTD